MTPLKIILGAALQWALVMTSGPPKQKISPEGIEWLQSGAN